MLLRLHYVKGQGAIAEVVLSRRNLLALLAKLEIEGSARALLSECCPPGWLFVVSSEDDEAHYESRDQAPGSMEPATEAWIEEHGQLQADAKPGEGDGPS